MMISNLISPSPGAYLMSFVSCYIHTNLNPCHRISDNLLLKMVLMNEDLGIEAIKQRLATFRNHLSYVDFDIPGLAREFNLDPARQKAVMIATAKKVLDITEDEIRAMSEELCDKWHHGCLHPFKQFQKRNG